MHFSRHFNAFFSKSVHTLTHFIFVMNIRRLLDNCMHFHLSGDELPQCVTSQCPLTDKNILIECNAFCDVRHKYSDVA